MPGGRVHNVSVPYACWEVKSLNASRNPRSDGKEGMPGIIPDLRNSVIYDQESSFTNSAMATAGSSLSGTPV